MKAIITGMNGTVAPVVGQRLAREGHTVVTWDRSVTPTDDPGAIRRFIDEAQPDWFLHIATGSADWTEAVARICAGAGIRFLFTGSVSVFADSQAGPFGVDATPGATDDYGRYKIECERRIWAANPDALVARLGWQIGTAPGSNNMVDYLYRTAQAQGRIEASGRWLTACAFLEDTADGLYRLLTGYPAGLYHLEGNPGLSFYEIAVGLRRLHGADWTVVRSEAPVWDNRLLEERIALRPITERLGLEG